MKKFTHNDFAEKIIDIHSHVGVHWGLMQKQDFHMRKPLKASI